MKEYKSIGKKRNEKEREKKKEAGMSSCNIWWHTGHDNVRAHGREEEKEEEEEEMYYLELFF